MTQRGPKYSKKNEPIEKFPKSLKILGGDGTGFGNTQIRAAFFGGASLSKRISKQNITNIGWPDKDIRHDDGRVGTWRITRVPPLLVFFCWHFVDLRVLPLLVFLTPGRVSNRSDAGSAPLVHLCPLYMHSISLEKRWRVQINSRWQNFSEELWERESL